MASDASHVGSPPAAQCDAVALGPGTVGPGTVGPGTVGPATGPVARGPAAEGCATAGEWCPCAVGPPATGAGGAWGAAAGLGGGVKPRGPIPVPIMVTPPRGGNPGVGWRGRAGCPPGGVLGFAPEAEPEGLSTPTPGGATPIIVPFNLARVRAASSGDPAGRPPAADAVAAGGAAPCGVGAAPACGGEDGRASGAPTALFIMSMVPLNLAPVLSFRL